ncbi:phosphate signaling complex protein PhoU [Eubacteriaceae bacterium DSM 108706]|uniref:Phosphate-specific transport system accessory protein PhoU n=2 Tax=Gallibacter intestinalis TaxID=2779356 RepID=A0ABR9QZ29_9FIRM|nr:phosphate signaling complex protein PhoU [Gallibacter intestinalis]
MRKVFDKELAMLNTRLIEMGDLCVEGIDMAIEVLFNRENIESKVQLIHTVERDTDRKERDIEDLCVNMILRQQPVAKDLRIISAALRMIADMERIGDQVADIADIAQKLESGEIFNLDTHIKDMANEVKGMVTNSIEAFVNKDVKMATDVVANDERVDQLFVQIKSELLRVLYQDISKGQIVLDILMVAKYFERIGDHATNVAQWVEYTYE